MYIDKLDEIVSKIPVGGCASIDIKDHARLDLGYSSDGDVIICLMTADDVLENGFPKIGFLESVQ